MDCSIPGFYMVAYLCMGKCCCTHMWEYAHLGMYTVKSCCSVTKSCLTLQPHWLHNARLLCLLPSPKACSNVYPLSCRWCYLTISSSTAPFSSCLQSYSASGYFPVSQLFALGGQSIGASAWASVLQMSFQNWFLLELTGLIPFQSQGLSRVFSSTTVWKHQFFGSQSSLWSNCHIHTWLLEKP